MCFKAWMGVSCSVGFRTEGTRHSLREVSCLLLHCKAYETTKIVIRPLFTILNSLSDYLFHCLFRGF